MAFTVADLDDFLALLRTHPEWRESVRLEILGDEIPSRLDRIEAALDRLTAAQARTDDRLEQLSAAQARTEERLEQLSAAQARTEERLEQLTIAQGRTEHALADLVVLVQNMNGRLGNIEGWVFERDFHTGARLNRYFRRLKAVDLADFEELDAARDAGAVSDDEAFQLAQADFIFRGRPRNDPSGGEVFIAIEVSRVVDARDIARARARAEVLRKAGLNAEAFVAGQRIVPEARSLAEQAGVRLMIDSPVEPAA